MASTSLATKLDLKLSKDDASLVDITNPSDGEYEAEEETDSEDENTSDKSAKNTKLTCEYDGCEFQCGRLRSMERHVYQTHNREKKYVCTYEGCDKRYVVGYHLTRHIQRFHEKKHLTKIVRIKCTVESCEKYFNTQQSLKRHLKMVHENRKTLKCTECDFQTTHGGSFSKHIKKHDPSRKPKQKTYGCPKCDKIFTKWSELQKHRKTDHSLSCSKCNETFQKWSELQLHRRTSHLPPCPICQCTFKHKQNIKVHMKLHEVKEENIRYTCTYEGCDKFYWQQNNLDHHIKTAHGGIHFKCPVEHCERTFTTLRKKRNHAKLHTEGNIVVERKLPAVKRAKVSRKKTSTLALLTGVDLDEESTQKLLEGRGNEIELEYESFTTTTDTDGEEVHVPKKFHIKTDEKH